jgi:hypothetical protein
MRKIRCICSTRRRPAKGIHRRTNDGLYLAVGSEHETGAHGYEVGYWPAGADITDPLQYVVQGRCYTQIEAQALATSFDANPPEQVAPGEGGGQHLSKSALEAMTKDELITQANERDIELPAHATKADIIDAIMRYERTHK